MRKGYRPHMMVDAKGRMFALATGADATSEHEWGSKELMTALCGEAGLTAEDLAKQLRRESGTLLNRMLQRDSVEKMLLKVPDLLERKRIRLNLDGLQYEERDVAGEPHAALTFSAHGRVETPFENRELDFNTFPKPLDIAGAWDNASFGFRVRGNKNVKRLREFVHALKAGKGIFAGTFLEKDGAERMSGVIIAIEDLLRPEHRSEMQAAQKKYTENVALHLRARTGELRELTGKLRDKSITHIWPVWRDGVIDGEIAYAVNPGYGVQIPYFGPYAFEALHDWLQSGAKGHLMPLERAQAAQT